MPGGHLDCTGCTHRTDDWKTGPTATFLGLLLFIVYSTAAAFQGEHYMYENYLSPMYSPVVFTQLERTVTTPEGETLKVAIPGAAPVEHAWFGLKPDAWPEWLPFSPAFLILAFPGAFRFTCYYYRKAYYRSFWANPIGCAVGPFRRGLYRGETHLLLFQNLHRYALYFAIVFIGILYYDAYMGFFRHGEFGVGLGSIVLLLNATFLACYTFGCHSFRHLVGGRLNWFSKSPLAHALWKRASFLNERHMFFAWLSLFWVGFTDFFVRATSMGWIPDISTWG
ncbi:MAG: succinate dehydrogenase [Planctomycetota bacterium]|nr:MAG: succinate dehydrogenase [Planctomycetota bacterium]